MISKEELEKIKNIIFNENITEEEKNNITNEINEEIEKQIQEFESESDPIEE